MKRVAIVSAALLSSCGGYTPPQPPSPSDATQVNASMGRTWDAVIDLFAARTVPITTIERVSGLIVTERLSVGREDGLAWADCGKTSGFMTATVHIAPNNGTYNVLVRGDSTRSSVKATVRWVHLDYKDGGVIECSTKHVYEQALEDAVKIRAEIPRIARGASEEPAIAARQTAADSTPRAQVLPKASQQTASSPHPPKRYASPQTPAGSGQRTSGGRINERLLADRDFTRAIHDLQALRFLGSFQELAGDSLLVEVSDAAPSTNLTEYNLGRLFSAYHRMTGWSPSAIIVFSRGQQLIGTYSRTGLVVRE